MKNKKCFLCKVLDSEDNLIKAEIGDKNKVERNVHPQCYGNYINRKMFFEYLFDEIDFPQLDRDTMIIINKLGKKYGFKIMLHALKIKKQAIIDNADKGYRYFLAIINKQLPFSEKEIKRNEKEKLNKPKIINESNVEEITVRIPKRVEVIEKEIEF